MKFRQSIAGAVSVVLSVCALAMDVPGDEATNRKLLAVWKSDPEKMDRIKQNLRAFRALPPDVQERLQKLDRDLHTQDSTDQARLRGVMERYAGWLSRLNAEQRQRIMDAQPGSERIKVIDEILDRQWQESLPRADREKLAKASAAERSTLLEQYRKEEADRRKLRLSARRTVEEAGTFGGLPFGQPEYRDKIQLYIEESLRPLLSASEDIQLATATRASNPRALWKALGDLSDGRSPLPYPGPSAPGRKKAIRTSRDLPSELAAKLPQPLPPAVANVEGKWPQFPEAVAALFKERGIEAPGNLLGPTKLEELPPSVQKFVRDELMPKLSEYEKKLLSDTAGKWPDYPKKIKEYADQKRLTVPGLGLPGTREMWQFIRAGKLGKAG